MSPKEHRSVMEGGAPEGRSPAGPAFARRTPACRVRSGDLASFARGLTTLVMNGCTVLTRCKL
jgi:hypothetical protein